MTARTLGLAVVSALTTGMLMPAAPADADVIVVGNANGDLIARDEFNLAAPLPNGFVTYGSTDFGITSMASGTNGEVLIGRRDGTPDVRPASNLTQNVNTTKFTGPALSSISSITGLPSGAVVLGTQDDTVFVRSRTDLTAYPVGYVPPDGANFGADITGLAGTSTGHVAIATASGILAARNGNNVALTAPGALADNVNYGSTISSLAMATGDRIVVGLAGGVVDIRSFNNVPVSLGNVNFGVGITALAALPNGDVAIGLANGQVHVRDVDSITGASSTFATFTGGAAITALDVTSNGNIVVGTADNLVFVRRGSDLTLTPVGFIGADGLNFNASIGGVAAVVVPEPATLAVVLLGGTFALARRRRRGEA